MPELTRPQLDAILHTMSRYVGLCKLGHCEHFADEPPLSFDEMCDLLDTIECLGLAFSNSSPQ